MSKEPTISCTVCEGMTSYYWVNANHSAHMVCDVCYIEMNQQVEKLSASDDWDDIRFADSFMEWRSGDVEYRKVTPQSMLERFLIQIFVEEE